MKNVEKRNKTVLSSTLWPPRKKVLCFDHVTNWSGGGERVGPRNNGIKTLCERIFGRGRTTGMIL